mgnify:FL=1
MPSVRSTLRWEEECAGSKVVSAKSPLEQNKKNSLALLRTTLVRFVVFVQCNNYMEAMRSMHGFGGRLACRRLPIVFLTRSVQQWTRRVPGASASGRMKAGDGNFMYRGRLKRDLDIWVEKGLIGKSVAEALLEEHDSRGSAFSIGGALMILAAV